jgi:hypothetical protein
VELFVASQENRVKKKCGDLGEFIINMFMSRFSFESDVALKTALLTEFFARQIFWIEKKIGSLERLHALEDASFLDRCFKSSSTSNFILVNLEAAKWFITDEKQTRQVDDRLGFVPESVIDAFQKRIVQIKAISDYRTLMSAISYENEINSSAKMRNLLLKSKSLAKKQQYVQ